MALVAIEKIRMSAFPAIRDEVDKAKVKELAESIKTHGLLNPLLVSGLTKDKTYELIDGHRRLLACRDVLKHNQVMVRVLDGAKAKLMAVQMVANVQREQLTAAEEAKQFQVLVETFGWTQAELAKELGKSKGYISDRMRVIKAVPEVMEALEKGDITLEAAREVASLSQEKQADALKEGEKAASTAPAKPGKPKKSNVSQAVRKVAAKKKGKKAPKTKKKLSKPAGDKYKKARKALAKEFGKLSEAGKLDKPQTLFFEQILDFLKAKGVLVV